MSVYFFTGGISRIGTFVFSWDNPNPIEYTIPPSASAYVVQVRRMSYEPTATFAMKIRGEPGTVSLTL